MRVSLPSPADFLDSTTSSSGPASSTFFKAPTERDDRSGFSSKGLRLSVASHCGASVYFVELRIPSSPLQGGDGHRRRMTTGLASRREDYGYFVATSTRREGVWMNVTYMVMFSSICSSSQLVASISDISRRGRWRSLDETPTIVLDPRSSLRAGIRKAKRIRMSHG